MAEFATANDDDKCAICLEPYADPYQLDCGHTFCRGCINEYKERGVNDVCPYCRAPLPPGAAQSVYECHKIGARINRFRETGDKKRFVVAMRLQLHHAQKAVKADPKSPMARYYLAFGLYAQKDFDGAEREYREGNRIDPNDYKSHLNLGVLLMDVRKDIDGAEREYREAIRCNPGCAMAHSNLGSVLGARKDFKGAEREFLAALRIDPDFANARCNFGVLIMQTSGDCEAAAREFRSALRSDPHHALALRSLQQVVAMQAAAGRSAKPAHAPPAGEPRALPAGLSSVKFNGARGTIASGCKDGRRTVNLPEHDGKTMAVKTEEIRQREHARSLRSAPRTLLLRYAARAWGLLQIATRFVKRLGGQT
jgi:tetratricopeptide (TPR) repeat protein